MLKRVQHDEGATYRFHVCNRYNCQRRRAAICSPPFATGRWIGREWDGPRGSGYSSSPVSVSALAETSA